MLEPCDGKLSRTVLRVEAYQIVICYTRSAEKMDTLNGFLESGLILLEEKENDEIIIGFLFGITVKEIKRMEILKLIKNEAEQVHNHQEY